MACVQTKPLSSSDGKNDRATSRKRQREEKAQSKHAASSVAHKPMVFLSSSDDKNDGETEKRCRLVTEKKTPAKNLKNDNDDPSSEREVAKVLQNCDNLPSSEREPNKKEKDALTKQKNVFLRLKCV